MTTTSEALTTARTLMNQHGLGHWHLTLDNAKNRHGMCTHGTQTISLSRHFIRLNDMERIRLTILHEIAHALTPGHNHDRVWAAKCREIGGNGLRCTADTNVAAAKYTGTCATCSKTYGRHKRVPAGTRHYCRNCHVRGNDARGLITWRLT